MNLQQNVLKENVKQYILEKLKGQSKPDREWEPLLSDTFIHHARAITSAIITSVEVNRCDFISCQKQRSLDLCSQAKSPFSLRGINLECKLQLHRAVLNESGSARGYDRSSCKRTRRWVRSCSCKDANRLTSTDTKLTKFSNSNTRKSNKSLLALWIR